MRDIVCPCCLRPMPTVPTPTRPEPLANPQHELVARLLSHPPVRWYTVAEVASWWREVEHPSRKQVEATRRVLERLVGHGRAERRDGGYSTTSGGRLPTEYRWRG